MNDAEKNKNSLRRQRILVEFGELALRSDDLEEILTEACRLIGEALGTDLAKVVELQEDGKTLLVRAGVGWKHGVIGVATVTASDDTSEGIALKSGEPMISPDVEKEKRFKYAPFLIENGVRAVSNVIIIGGKNRPPFGILQVDSREPRDFTQDDTIFLRGYANLIAAAVDRLRTFGELRTRDMQLHQAQKLEAVGRLAAGVAHDFNNILQSISGGLELVLDDIENGTPAHNFAEVALTSAHRGSYLTHHLLSYARKQMLQPKQIDVGLFLAEIYKLLSRTLGIHVVTEIRVDLALPCICVDPGQLQTALLNLAINASHAMQGKGTLTLEASENSYAGKGYVVIAVTDTGLGMDAATLAQVFEPFFTTKGSDGTGLGLSMVQGFAKQSGGEVRIESTPGNGATIELWLPATQMVNPSHKLPLASAKLSGSGRILLVDDTAEVLAVSGALLEKAGFQVVRAGSGVQALAALAAGERFDALVTDYAMPRMNGIELLTQARALQPGLACLIITGFAEIEPADMLPEAVRVMHKPFSRQQLIEVLVQCIEKRAE